MLKLRLEVIDGRFRKLDHVEELGVGFWRELGVVGHIEPLS